MARTQIRQYVFTPGAAGVGTIRIPGRINLDRLLLVVNVTRNSVLYNFADVTYINTAAAFTAGNDATNFPTIAQREDGFTTITLAISTVGQNSADRLQIMVEEQNVKFRPFDFGTDAIERMRVSNPQSLIDADFEYGLQPTKWAGYGLMRGYPSAYDIPGVDLTVSSITTDFTGTSGSNSLITVVFTTVHGLTGGSSVVNVSGLNRGVTGFSRADGNFIVFDAPNTTTIRYFARGLVGVFNGQSMLTDDTLAKRAALYAGATIPVASASSNGLNPSTITLNFSNPHGLLPGTSIHASIASGSNVALASGPFIVTSVPSATSLTYTARSGAVVASPAIVTLYAFSNATILHRPQDGGVILTNNSPTYGATVVRQSKRYFRYQSGKGFLWSTGTLIRPNYDLLSITASSTLAGATITVTTDDIVHGLQVGAVVSIAGVITSGYAGTYTVTSIISDYQFTVTAGTSLGATTAVLDIECRVFINAWAGSAIRAGMFDDQNGLFWEYNGQVLAVVRRSSTFQITGTVTASANSNLISGTNTRFTEQLKVGDKISVRGMTHYVSGVASNTTMYVTPDYRGGTASGIKANLVRETRIPQSQFNVDRCDGTGPSGFNWDLNKMQMIGLQYTWYGAGFVDFMVRGSDGNWLTAHRIKNNNVNNEAYMRSGNLPVRYSIENDSPPAFLTASITNIQTTIPLNDLTYFPNSGIVYIDNELISYSSKSAATGAGNLNVSARAATMSQYISGTTYSLTAGSNVIHNQGVGVILVSNTCSPTLSHWGSALIMDGGYDTDRGYIFNYQRTGLTLSTTNVTAFVIRLAPSVENSQVGALGSRDLLNRSQLLLNAIGIAVSGGGGSLGSVVVEGVLNPKNFANATWQSLNLESQGGQPSFCQVATSITWTSGTFAVPGEQVFAFAGATASSGSTSDRLDLLELKELTGAPLGGDFVYPDGSDILAINVRLTTGTGTAAVLLRWGEAQA